MTYAIGFVVYGISLRDAPELSYDDKEMIAEFKLATSEYSGSGEGPLYVGACLGSIDECGDLQFSELFKFVVTDKHKKEFEAQRQKLLDHPDYDEETAEQEGGVTADFKNWFRVQEPSLFITWGSS